MRRFLSIFIVIFCSLSLWPFQSVFQSFCCCFFVVFLCHFLFLTDLGHFLHFFIYSFVVFFCHHFLNCVFAPIFLIFFFVLFRHFFILFAPFLLLLQLLYLPYSFRLLPFFCRLFLGLFCHFYATCVLYTFFLTRFVTALFLFSPFLSPCW